MLGVAEIVETLTLLSRILSASTLPSSPVLVFATSRPALDKMASTAARLNSKPARVVMRAPSMANPPTKVPNRREREAESVNRVTSEATGAGSKVLAGICFGRSESII